MLCGGILDFCANITLQYVVLVMFGLFCQVTMVLAALFLQLGSFSLYVYHVY